MGMMMDGCMHACMHACMEKTYGWVGWKKDGWKTEGRVCRWMENKWKRSWMKVRHGFMTRRLEARGTEGTESSTWGQRWGQLVVGRVETPLSTRPQVWQQGGVHGLHERIPGAGVDQHAAVPLRDLQPGHPHQQHQLRGLHRPGPRALHPARPPLGGHVPAQQGTWDIWVLSWVLIGVLGALVFSWVVIRDLGALVHPVGCSGVLDIWLPLGGHFGVPTTRATLRGHGGFLCPPLGSHFGVLPPHVPQGPLLGSHPLACPPKGGHWGSHQPMPSWGGGHWDSGGWDLGEKGGVTDDFLPRRPC